MTASIKFSDLPALNAPLDGGTFVGITTTPDGGHFAVVFLAESASRLEWKEAREWAESFDTSPTSSAILTMASANVPSLFKRSGYWCHEASDRNRGVCLYTPDGVSHHRDPFEECGAVAARTIKIEA